MDSSKLEFALKYFSEGMYDCCIEMMIECYDKGIEQEWILEFFYSNFINPNEGEFKDNFKRNTEGFTGLAYEDCSVDFIPVSDREFYLYYKPQKAFAGKLVMEGVNKSEFKDFHNLLIADVGDIREMIPFMIQKEYREIFIVLEDHEDVFSSFFKLPGFNELYMKGVKTFSSLSSMEEFFMANPDVYLPKNIVSRDEDRCREVIHRVHEARLKSDEGRNNVFLSIAVPSYNRGHRALDTVKWLTNMDYDSEVEILVFDNASTKNTEGYAEIEELQKSDSRIRYFRNPENIGPSGSIHRAFELSKGHFLLVQSDEDYLDHDNLRDCINCMYNHEDAGTIMFSVSGPNGLLLYEGETRDKGHCLSEAFNARYMSGLCFNEGMFKRLGLSQVYKEAGKYNFVKMYPHCFCMALLAYYSFTYKSKYVIYREGLSDDGSDKEVKGYMRLEQRIAHQNERMEVVDAFFKLTDEQYIGFFLDAMNSTYYLLTLYYELTEENCDDGSWEDICRAVNENNELRIDCLKNTPRASAIDELHFISKRLYVKYIDSFNRRDA